MHLQIINKLMSNIKPEKTDQSSSSAEEDNSASGALIRWIEVFWTALKTHASGAGLDDESNAGGDD